MAAALDDGEAHDAAGHGGDVAGAAEVVDGHAGQGELAAGRFAQVMEDEEAGVGVVGEAAEVGEQALGVLDAVLAAAADAAVGVDDDELRAQGVDHVGEAVLPAALVRSKISPLLGMSR